MFHIGWGDGFGIFLRISMSLAVEGCAQSYKLLLAEPNNQPYCYRETDVF